MAASFSTQVASVLIALCSLCNASNEAGNTTSDLSVKAVERVNVYRDSIKFWDTDVPEIQQAVLKELAVGEDVKFPGCPRIRYPIICDNDKVILENSCYFRMRRLERSGLLPVMVFTKTPIEAARQKCQSESLTS